MNRGRKSRPKNKKRLKIAIPKGRVLKDSLELLRNAGYISHPDKDYDSRRLIFDYEDDSVSLLIVKPWDVPTFVEYGASDAGFSGRDVLLEEPKNVYEPLDLKIGKCMIAVAAGTGFSNSTDIYFSKTNLRVATKYVHIAKDFFNRKGVANIQIIKLYGNIELAPVSGLSDLIVDLVSTGETLRQNKLTPVEEIAKISSRLVVNRASLKINPAEIHNLIEDLRAQVK